MSFLLRFDLCTPACPLRECARIPVRSFFSHVQRNLRGHETLVHRSSPDASQTISPSIYTQDHFLSLTITADAPTKLRLDRAAGALVGLAVADSYGHWFEFHPATESDPGFEFVHDPVPASGDGTVVPVDSAPPGASGDGTVVVDLALSSDLDPRRISAAGRANTFGLKWGQWTDDTSMSLCLADSLLVVALNDIYSGSDLRCRFWQWWNTGYKNWEVIGGQPSTIPEQFMTVLRGLHDGIHDLSGTNLNATTISTHERDYFVLGLTNCYSGRRNCH